VANIKTISSATMALYADTGQFPGHYELMAVPLLDGTSQGTHGDNRHTPDVVLERRAGNAGTWVDFPGYDGPYIDKAPIAPWGQGGRAWAWSYQNSCADRNKDWDGDSGCEMFFCYQPQPPIEAQIRIDEVMEDDGPWAGKIRSRIDCGQAGYWCGEGTTTSRCFWPGFIDE